MKWRNRLTCFVLICFSLLAGCGQGMNQELGDLTTITGDAPAANRERFIQIAQDFYAEHPDDYDMLVFWGSAFFGPGHSFFLPTKNDVTGLGFGNVGPDLFDTSQDFGSSRLQGIVWMGPDWINNPELAGGPRSVLGILAHETGHRWSCLVHFKNPDKNAPPEDALLSDATHWSFFLDTGASPLGGNEWQDVDDSHFKAVPVDHVAYSPLELYLMGLMAPEDVAPLRLLTNLRDEQDQAIGGVTALSNRVISELTVKADLFLIPIDQVIAAEGPRGESFNASHIRQAWIYVADPNTPISQEELDRLQGLQSQWPDFYFQATGGLGEISLD